MFGYKGTPVSLVAVRFMVEVYICLEMILNIGCNGPLVL
jgi:hypothetical protein